MYSWEFQKLANLPEDNDQLALAIQQTFIDGFKPKRTWTIEKIKKRLKQSTILGLLESTNREINGYAFYSVPEVKIGGSYLLWEDAICLKKAFQLKGYSKDIFELARNQFPGYDFGWIGGRTQNPQVIYRYSKLGRVFPFDVKYTDSEGQLVMNFLLQYIGEVRDARGLDRNTGILRKLYDGSLGDYSRDINEKNARFETQLQRWNFNRDDGDAIVVVSQLSPL